MHQIVSNNTIVPTVIDPADYQSMEVIEDYMRLKPKPEKDVCLIMGDSKHVLDDIGAWYDMAEGIVPYDTMCLNFAAMVCPHKFEHYAAGDSHMKDMQAVAKDLGDDVLKHAWNPTSIGFDIRWIRNGRGGWNGTTGNLALKIALALDYTRIVLAGCPMDNSGNWYSDEVPEDDIKANKDHRHHLWKWMEISCRPIGKFVRSMSGNTRDLFGEPNRAWLCHEPETQGEEQWQKMN